MYHDSLKTGYKYAVLCPSKGKKNSHKTMKQPNFLAKGVRMLFAKDYFQPYSWCTILNI